MTNQYKYSYNSMLLLSAGKMFVVVNISPTSFAEVMIARPLALRPPSVPFRFFPAVFIRILPFHPIRFHSVSVSVFLPFLGLFFFVCVRACVCLAALAKVLRASFARSRRRGGARHGAATPVLRDGPATGARLGSARCHHVAAGQATCCDDPLPLVGDMTPQPYLPGRAHLLFVHVITVTKTLSAVLLIVKAL